MAKKKLKIKTKVEGLNANWFQELLQASVMMKVWYWLSTKPTRSTEKKREFRNRPIHNMYNIFL